MFNNITQTNAHVIWVLLMSSSITGITKSLYWPEAEMRWNDISRLSRLFKKRTYLVLCLIANCIFCRRRLSLAIHWKINCVEILGQWNIYSPQEIVLRCVTVIVLIWEEGKHTYFFFENLLFLLSTCCIICMYVYSENPKVIDHKGHIYIIIFDTLYE